VGLRPVAGRKQVCTETVQTANLLEVRAKPLVGLGSLGKIGVVLTKLKRLKMQSEPLTEWAV